MATASTVEQYMAQHDLRHEVLSHPHSHSSIETAELAQVPGDRVAKSVVLEDEDGYVMAVLPSTYNVRLSKLGRDLNRRLRLATEDQIEGLFADCERGAVPPLGLAYGMPTIVDESLCRQPDVYFEAGDHERLIHMGQDAFAALMEHAGRGSFGHRVWASIPA